MFSAYKRDCNNGKSDQNTAIAFIINNKSQSQIIDNPARIWWVIVGNVRALLTSENITYGRKVR